MRIELYFNDELYVGNLSYRFKDQIKNVVFVEYFLDGTARKSFDTFMENIFLQILFTSKS